MNLAKGVTAPAAPARVVRETPWKPFAAGAESTNMRQGFCFMLHEGRI
jgi:hypothetical protein